MEIFPIIGEHDKERLRVLKAGMLDGQAHFDRSWLSARDWIVVPVESAGHFAEDDAQSLSCAFYKMGFAEVFAIATEPLGDDEFFLVGTSKRGLLEFSETCSHFNFVLTPGGRSCAVLCTVYDYYLVAGPPEFVATAVGGNVYQARRRFDEVAADPFWEGRLERVAQRYNPSSRVS